MLKLITFLWSLTLLCTCASAQSSGSLSGQIVDKQTLAPISFVHIRCLHEQTISDSHGMFSIHLVLSDTLSFSHINFEQYRISISDTPNQAVHIYLKNKENILQEIIIRDYLPEEELKREMIEHEVKYTVEEVNAINNVEFSTVLYKKGYTPEMNSLDNFKNYIKEPQGVTLFSSNPSKGLIKSLKRLNQQNKDFSENRLKLNQVKSDTIRNDQFLKAIK